MVKTLKKFIQNVINFMAALSRISPGEVKLFATKSAKKKLWKPQESWFNYVS